MTTDSPHLIILRQSAINSNIPRPRLKSTIISLAWQSTIHQIISDLGQEAFVIGSKGGMLY